MWKKKTWKTRNVTEKRFCMNKIKTSRVYFLVTRSWMFFKKPQKVFLFLLVSTFSCYNYVLRLLRNASSRYVSITQEQPNRGFRKDYTDNLLLNLGLSKSQQHLISLLQIPCSELIKSKCLLEVTDSVAPSKMLCSSDLTTAIS